MSLDLPTLECMYGYLLLFVLGCNSKREDIPFNILFRVDIITILHMKKERPKVTQIIATEVGFRLQACMFPNSLLFHHTRQASLLLA